MKKIIVALLFVLFVSPIYAEILDSYNVAIMARSASSEYKFITSSLQKCLEEKGFEVYVGRKWSDFPKEERSRMIAVTYDVSIQYGAPSIVCVRFTNALNEEIVRFCESGYSFTLKGNLRIATEKIVKAIEEIPYEYTNQVDKAQFPPILMSEDSVKNYLSRNKIADIEGIYKTIGNHYYRFAVIRQEEKYAAFFLEKREPFEEGDVLAYFEPTSNFFYMATYLDGIKVSHEGVAYYREKPSSINIQYDTDYGIDSLFAVKIFPNNKTTAMVHSGTMIGSGSGFFISDRIIATNYHVVDNAQEIKIVVKDGTEVKSYAAKVLVTDKTNDLALVSITDKEFNGVWDIPYSLYLDTKEVGTSIFSMGYPMSNILGGEVKITDGIINSKTGYEGDIATYQISSPIQPGNSGGALFDKNGVLVGITNAGVLSAQNVGYAIKATYLKNLIDAAPVYIDLPKGKNLTGRDLTDLVKILSPYIVLVEIY